MAGTFRIELLEPYGRRSSGVGVTKPGEPFDILAAYPTHVQECGFPVWSDLQVGAPLNNLIDDTQESRGGDIVWVPGLILHRRLSISASYGEGANHEGQSEQSHMVRLDYSYQA